MTGVLKSFCATYEVVTPMFLGDGDQQASAIRPPSVKGVLRHFWRASVWPLFSAEYQNDELALKALHQVELDLFGSPSGQANAGQSKVLLQILPADGNTKLTLGKHWVNRANSEEGYLAYGLVGVDRNASDRNTTVRNAIMPGYRFVVKLTLLPTIKSHPCIESVPNSLKEALKLMGRIGGLGARSRNANGSITLVELDGDNQLLDLAEYDAYLNKLGSENNIGYPPFSALSQYCQRKLFPKDPKVEKAYKALAIHYKAFNKQLHSDEKAKLGLPRGHLTKERRTSPFYFHIQKLKCGSLAPAIFFMPAHFHHSRELPERLKHQNDDEMTAAFYANVAGLVSTRTFS